MNAEEVRGLARRTAFLYHELELLEKRGTGNQRERHAAGLLPEDELLALARSVLFAPFAWFDRWEKIKPSDVHHAACGGLAEFSTRKAPSLLAREWSMFQTILDTSYHANDGILNDLGSQPCQVEIVEHVGYCSTCGFEVVGRAASVRIQWAGRPLSREYSLEMT
jgi:hypothetical protein